MESLLAELKSVLEKEEYVLEQLLSIAREHNRALRQLDSGVLYSITRKEEELAAALGREECRREKICGELARELNLSGAAVLSEFISRAPFPYNKDLSRLLEDMRSIAGDLAAVNEINALLTRQAMRVNEMLLRAIGPAGNRVYTPDGRMRQEHQQLTMVNKKA